MPCRLSDSYTYSKYEHRPEIPREPLCRPHRWYKSLFKSIAFGVAVYIAWLIYSLTSSSPDSFQTFIDASFPAGIVYALAVFIYTKKMDKDLQNPNKNPYGYEYQGRVLRKDHPHFLLHLEYYKRHGVWELPDDINPSDYLSPEEMQLPLY